MLDTFFFSIVSVVSVSWIPSDRDLHHPERLARRSDRFRFLATITEEAEQGRRSEPLEGVSFSAAHRALASISACGVVLSFFIGVSISRSEDSIVRATGYQHVTVEFGPELPASAAFASPLGAHSVVRVDLVAVDITDEAINVTASFPAVVPRPKSTNKSRQDNRP